MQQVGRLTTPLCFTVSESKGGRSPHRQLVAHWTDISS